MELLMNIPTYRQTNRQVNGRRDEKEEDRAIELFSLRAVVAGLRFFVPGAIEHMQQQQPQSVWLPWLDSI